MVCLFYVPSWSIFQASSFMGELVGKLPARAMRSWKEFILFSLLWAVPFGC